MLTVNGPFMPNLGLSSSWGKVPDPETSKSLWGNWAGMEGPVSWWPGMRHWHHSSPSSFASWKHFSFFYQGMEWSHHSYNFWEYCSSLTSDEAWVIKTPGSLSYEPSVSIFLVNQFMSMLPYATGFLNNFLPFKRNNMASKLTRRSNLDLFLNPP